MSSTETIVLVMADAVRRTATFAALAGPSRRIVRSFADARDAVDALEGDDAACLVIDPAGFATSAIEQLLRRAAQQPAVVTMMLADHLDARTAMALVQAYPADIMPHASTSAALAERLALLLPMAIQRRTLWHDRMVAERALARLSPRETGVLAALANGQTSKDIARALGVSPRTVEVHRASIMRRTNTATLAELLRLYFCVAYAAGGGGAGISSKAA